jgi:hypothetical protein
MAVLDFDEIPLWLQGDETRLTYILASLMKNSVQRNPFYAGVVNMKVSVKVVDD